MQPLAMRCDPAIEWVNPRRGPRDLRMMKKMWEFRHAVNVFDITMGAWNCLNAPELGLAANPKKYFGVELNKKFQKADWSQTPVDIGTCLAYAAMDTTHPVSAARHPEEELEDKGPHDLGNRRSSAAWCTSPRPVEEGVPPVERMKALKPKQLAVLRGAKRLGKLDRAPFMFQVMGCSREQNHRPTSTSSPR